MTSVLVTLVLFMAFIGFLHHREEVARLRTLESLARMRALEPDEEQRKALKAAMVELEGDL